eukprot:CAMPEP_0117003614 /NCGR_PEP_ID=MMETSP0472-20121206/4871_1 /TAXON_ID=693140 ORGANISM="Tiarina fusus, Strain LIS" /NCGR_SAMPLE_ID=MMETSP0472 /ASSEMBLY_ACC=CAM_ASM_000603 /LENGTH=307 /DNA_ID=CAMNT_0004704313 /DNA_START=658 /DNA_END=1577 /DNA_ORIENTATION=+
MSKFLQCSSGTSFHEQKLRLSKRLLILINPKAGSGNAWNIYLKIAHVFDIAGIQCDSVYLDNTSHAAQILRDANLGTYFAIACCGGDGLMHHTIDTIYRRGINIPTFCIPAGHGVGIAASILAHASPLSAAYSIAKGFRRPLDIMEIKQNGSVMCYSSLLVSWGLVADIEFETAGLRWMGPIRYKMGAIAAITKPPLHHLRISYLPAKSNTMAFCTGGGCKVCSKGAALARENEEKSDHSANGLEGEEEGGESALYEEDWMVEEGKFIMVIALTLSDTTQNHRIAPYAHASDGCIDLVFMKDVSRAG